MPLHFQEMRGEVEIAVVPLSLINPFNLTLDIFRNTSAEEDYFDTVLESTCTLRVHSGSAFRLLTFSAASFERGLLILKDNSISNFL